MTYKPSINPVAYFVPVDQYGFTTTVEWAIGRKLWCAHCAEPCDKTLEPPVTHIPVAAFQVMPGECCHICGSELNPSLTGVVEDDLQTPHQS